jgi:ubiquitin carboxyl-terminal hydrolase 34
MNIRNYNKEKIESIVSEIDSMYKRLLQKIEYKHKVFELEYLIAYRCFKSQYLERRIQGLKAIIDCSRKVRFNNMK